MQRDEQGLLQIRDPRNKICLLASGRAASTRQASLKGEPLIPVFSMTGPHRSISDLTFSPRWGGVVLGPRLPPRSRSRIGGDGGAHDGGGGDHRSGGHHAGARVAVRDRDRGNRSPVATYCAWAMISLHR